MTPLRNFTVACGSEVAMVSTFTAMTVGYAVSEAKIAIISAGVFTGIAVVACRGIKLFTDTRKENAKDWKSVSKCLNFASVSLLVNWDHLTRNIMMHEFGHLIAGHLVYKNHKFDISITKFSMRRVEAFVTPALIPGKPWKGFKFSRPIFAAGGPLMALVCSCIMIGLAQFYGDVYEGFSVYLRMAAVISIVQHILYAVSASWSDCTNSALGLPNQATHDFAIMAKFGIHPGLRIAAFVLLPLAVWAGCSYYSTMTKPCSDTGPALPIGSF